MRPKYETNETLAHEKRCLKLLERELGGQVIKVPISYRVDAVQEKGGRIRAWIEFKGRKMSLNAYPSVMLSVLKYDRGMQLAWSTEAKFIFAVDFEEGLYYARLDHLKPDKFFIKMGGRTVQTRDSADIEPVIFIPIKFFDKVEVEETDDGN